MNNTSSNSKAPQDNVKYSVKAVFASNDNRPTFGDQQTCYVEWKHEGHSPFGAFVAASAEDKKEFGLGVFRAGKGEFKAEHIAKIDPKGMKIYFVDNDHYVKTDQVKWEEPIKLSWLVIHNKELFEQAYEPLPPEIEKPITSSVHMSPQQTVYMMMRAYPSLYPTRVDALKEIFDTKDTFWEKGELRYGAQAMEEFGKLRDRDYLPDHYQLKNSKEAIHRLTTDEKNKQGSSVKEREELYSACESLLFNLKEYDKDSSVFRNAKGLSRLSSSEFDQSPFDFSGTHLKDIPNDVTPEWMGAAKELAEAIRNNEFKPNPNYHQSKNESDHKDFLASRQIATEFLEEIGAININSQDRTVRIEAIKKELNALGLNGAAEMIQSILKDQGHDQEIEGESER